MSALASPATAGVHPSAPTTFRAVMDSRRAEGRRLSLDDAIAVIVPVCVDLKERHARGEAHYVHPSAISSGPDGLMRLNPQLAINPKDPRDRAALAPEVLRSNGPGDARASVFAVGAMLYEAVCGTPVGPGMRRPRDVTPELPEALEHLLAKALVADPLPSPGRPRRARERDASPRADEEHPAAGRGRLEARSLRELRGRHPSLDHAARARSGRGAAPAVHPAADGSGVVAHGGAGAGASAGTDRAGSDAPARRAQGAPRVRSASALRREQGAHGPRPVQRRRAPPADRVAQVRRQGHPPRRAHRRVEGDRRVGGVRALRPARAHAPRHRAREEGSREGREGREEGRRREVHHRHRHGLRAPRASASSSSSSRSARARTAAI